MERTSGTLAGLAVGVKDVIRVDGFPTRAGSRLPVHLFDGTQASAVDRLIAAGATVAGKTVTAEFALTAPGATLNPLDPARTPGGSSSGSAAAVAAGLVPLALGTQTVGSVIRPAAFCGVVGFRPTKGAFPGDGLIHNSPTLDTIGVFAPDVASVTTASRVLAGWDEVNNSEPAELPALAVPGGSYLDALTAEGAEAFDLHITKLRQAGYQVTQVDLPCELRELDRQLNVLQRYELAQVHASWFPAFRDLYRPESARAVEEGQAITADQYQSSLVWRDIYRAKLRDLMEHRHIDVWVSPSAPGLAPLGLASTGSAVMSAPFSLAGLPAISLPARGPSTSLPFGVQFAAGEGQDRYLLSVSEALQWAIA
ncbi:amidase [Herbiconiux sp. L3-i23]|uniref:amidase n=1 Tax=Herbiconiux sp. L3-i23 TaxID=2905871 RepID=UPI002073560C|nr:amidase [Herbiconiux sp. L3-i23]